MDPEGVVGLEDGVFLGGVFKLVRFSPGSILKCPGQELTGTAHGLIENVGIIKMFLFYIGQM